MSNETWLESKLRGVGGRVTYETERLVIGINEQIVEQMEAQNITRADLANRLGVNKAQITRMLNGAPNLTVRSLVSVASALGCRIAVPVISRLEEPAETRTVAKFERPPGITLDLLLNTSFTPLNVNRTLFLPNRMTANQILTETNQEETFADECSAAAA